MGYFRVLVLGLCLVFGLSARAAVSSINKSTAPENSVITAHGSNLGGASACLRVTNTATGDLVCINLPVSINRRGSRARVTMPFVSNDIKGSLVFTSGPNDREQDFYVLILDNPRSEADPDTPVVGDDFGDLLAAGSGAGSAEAGPQGPQGPQGPAGPVGPEGSQGLRGDAGINCWDLDMDRRDDSAEDINLDGFFDTFDCIGPIGLTGATGPQGDNGAIGATGLTGANGDAGINCWDLDLDRVNDPAEDINSDGSFNTLDCQGPQGTKGEDGTLGGGTITGTVNGCAALADESFSVHLANTSGSVQLDSGRAFSFTSVPAGTYTVIINQYGIKAASKSSVVVTNGNGTNLGPVTIADCG